MIDYPVRITDIHVRDKLRELIDAVNAQVPAVAANTAAIAAATPALTIPQIQQAIQLGGSNPINITGLQGTLAQPQVAVLSGTHAVRLATAATAGGIFYETDRTVLYVGVASGSSIAWQYAAGTYTSVFANRPVDLGTNDRGFTLWITVENHICIWAGTVWTIVDGGGGYFLDSAIALGLGYQLCDGTTTSYLAISGSDLAETPFTTPDETTANPGTYHTSAASYTGTVNAATTPTFTGTPAVLTGSVAAPVFSGTPGTTGADGDAGVNIATAGATLVALNPHTHSFTAAGTNSAPALTMNSYTPGGTLSISGGAPVKNLGVLRYFRR